MAAMPSDSLIKKFFTALKNVRSLLSYDPITGSPQITFSFLAGSEKATTLKSIFDFLEITLDDAKSAATSILRFEITNFIERRNLITDKQWRFLVAVAKEGSVKQPTASAFLMKYGIGNSATAKKILTAAPQQGAVA